jgi:hypothetical protein
VIEYNSLPAQAWNKLANLYCADKIAAYGLKSKRGKPVSIPAGAFGSHLVTCTGIGYGEYSAIKAPTVHLQKLVPTAAFNGPTHVDPSDAVRVADVSMYRGLMVSFRGTEYVCASEIDVRLTLPTTVPVPLSEAMAIEQRDWERSALGYGYMIARKEIGVTWRLLGAHPVACYGDSCRLYWRDAGKMHLLPVSPDCGLHDITDEPAMNSLPMIAVLAGEQLSLF